MVKNLGAPSKNVEDQYVARRGKGSRQDPAGYKESAEDVRARILLENDWKRQMRDIGKSYQEALKGKKDKYK